MHKQNQPPIVPVTRYRADLDYDSRKTFLCKHCKVPVYGRLDFRAILGREHKSSCPRHKRGK